MRLLAALGRHASTVLIAGMVGALFMPSVSAWLRPVLPLLVSLILGLGMARLDLREATVGMLRPRTFVRLGVQTLALSTVFGVVIVALGRLLGASDAVLLALLVFAAAPPLSSSTSVCLMLGFDATTALRLSLLGTLLLPLSAPLNFAINGLEVDTALLPLAVSMALMIAGGFVVGLGLQAAVGREKLATHSEVFNGIVALAMLLFLFPLLDGVSAYAHAKPVAMVGWLALACTLSFGANVATTRLVHRIGGAAASGATARALGYVAGNRNVSFFLAVLPASPELAAFVAAAQLPIYTTPALSRWWAGRQKTKVVE